MMNSYLLCLIPVALVVIVIGYSRVKKAIPKKLKQWRPRILAYLFPEESKQEVRSWLFPNDEYLLAGDIGPRESSILVIRYHQKTDRYEIISDEYYNNPTMFQLAKRIKMFCEEFNIPRRQQIYDLPHGHRGDFEYLLDGMRPQ